MRNPRFRLSTIVPALVVALPAAAGAPHALIGGVLDGAGWGPPLAVWATEEHLVSIDGDALAALAADGVGGRVEVVVPGRAGLVGVAERVKAQGGGDFDWVGTLEGADGLLTMVVRGGVVAAHLRGPRVGSFSIRYAGDGAHVITAVDTDALRPCGVDPALDIIRGHAGAQQPAPGVEGRIGAQTTGGETLFADVLMVYTDDARVAAGGTNSMRAICDLAIVDTNLGFQRSNIPFEVRTVLRAELEYTETGDSGLDLSRLRIPFDGFLDDAHDLRDQYGADFVHLIVRDMFDACGRAYLMGFPSAGFEDSAFGVTGLGCTGSGYVVAHELGHNMGCHHDRDNAGGQGSYPYSYGYRTPDQTTFRTIMAYSPGFWIANYSNPDVLEVGLPTGIPVGQPGETHNAQTITLNSPTIAAWRNHVPRVSTSVMASDGTFNDRVVVTWNGPANATGYEVWRGVSADPLSATRIAVLGDVFTYNDFGAMEGVVYNYWVKARYVDGGVGPFSEPDQGALAEVVAGDLNGDGMVNGTDLAILLGSWGGAGGVADIDGDGDVDGSDLALLLGNWSN